MVEVVYYFCKLWRWDRWIVVINFILVKDTNISSIENICCAILHTEETRTECNIIYSFYVQYVSTKMKVKSRRIMSFINKKKIWRCYHRILFLLVQEMKANLVIESCVSLHNLKISFEISSVLFYPILCGSIYRSQK